MAFSIAHTRSGHLLAHTNNRSNCSTLTLTLILANTFSDESITVAVCDALCGSIPIITVATTGLLQLDGQSNPSGMSDFRCLKLGPLWSHTRSDATGGHLVRKPEPKVGRRFVNPTHRIR